MAKIDPQKNEAEFNRFLLCEYLKYGSVDAVLKKHYYGLPISTASYHRLLDKNGVVKAAGPHGKIAEALAFMEYLAEEKLPLERLYKKLPPSFVTSKITLHRIYNYIKRGITRRAATGLVISPEKEPQKILLAKDNSISRLTYGKIKGMLSIPMTFSKMGENPRRSIRRVLQQEVFSQMTVDGIFPDELLSQDLSLVLKIRILDISLSVYRLVIPDDLSVKVSFSSFRMSEHNFMCLGELEKLAQEGKLRSGVLEIANFYRQSLVQGIASEKTALINQQLAHVHIK